MIAGTPHPAAAVRNPAFLEPPALYERFTVTYPSGTVIESLLCRTVGKLVDDAMEAVERDNPSLKDVLPKDYARPALDKQRETGM